MDKDIENVFRRLRGLGEEVWGLLRRTGERLIRRGGRPRTPPAAG
jgi:hypothetical protein